MNKTCRNAAMVLLMTLVIFCLTGCNRSRVKVGTDAQTAQVRTTTCALCDGSGVCWHCNGDGFRDGRRCKICDGEKTCDVCQGAGRREVLVIDGQDYVYCGECHGSGKCTYCDGSGKDPNTIFIFNKSVTSKCPFCSGGGKCLLCHGKGVTRLSGF